MPNAPFRDKVAIVTGASSGIGRELSLRLADQGARIVLASRNRARLEKLKEECLERSGRALVLPTDVVDKEACRLLVEKTVAEFGGIDLLVNNAGYGFVGDMIDLQDISLFDSLFQVNCLGSVYCTYFALPHLLESKGWIVGISSVAGWFAAPGNAAYCSSKFAMRAFFDSLRMELGDKGVSVTMIYPGYVVTEFAAHVVGPDGTTRGERALKFYKKSMMSAEACARITLKAAAKRKRQVLMTAAARVGRVLQLFTPRLLDRVTIKYRAARDRRVARILSE